MTHPIKYYFSRIIGISSLMIASSTAMAAEPLMSPNDVQSIATNPTVRVIDIRAPKDYQAGHITNAANAPYGQWRGPKTNPGELPALKELTALVQNLGLDPQTHAVVVSSGATDTDFGAAARVYWTLKVLGLENLSILNGGMAAWKAAGLTVSDQSPSITPSSFKPSINNALIVSQQQVAQDTQNAQAILVDARPAAFFNGDTRHGAAKTPGTLPGAVNVAHSVWFKPGSTQVIDASQAKSVAAKFDLADNDKEIVSFCNTGHWAATNWFVLSELVGDKNVKLYAGSMVDWTQAKEPLPMDNVPGRIKQLWIDTQLWFSGL